MKLAAVILAAGQSRRFGKDNKLHSLVGGRPMLGMTFDAIDAELFTQRLAVIDPADDRALRLARSAGIDTVENPDCRLGMGTSIARGIAARAHDIDAVFIFLGDMPFIARDTIRFLAQSAQTNRDTRDIILVPTFNGDPGHPVIFGARYFDRLAELNADTGARTIVTSAEGALVLDVEVNDPGILRDIDTPGDVPADR